MLMLMLMLGERTARQPSRSAPHFHDGFLWFCLLFLSFFLSLVLSFLLLDVLSLESRLESF